MEEKQLFEAVFDKWCKKRLVPDWSIKLEFVTDRWPKTGDFKIDCDDKTANFDAQYRIRTKAGKLRGA